MKITGNANFYVNKMVNKDGSTRYAVSVGVFTKKKDSNEYSRCYIPCIMDKSITINEKTQQKFKAHLDDASLIASEWNGNTTLKMYVAKISAPVEEKKAETKETGDELPY